MNGFEPFGFNIKPSVQILSVQSQIELNHKTFIFFWCGSEFTKKSSSEFKTNSL